MDTKQYSAADRRAAKRRLRHPEYVALQSRYKDTLAQRDRAVQELKAAQFRVEALEKELAEAEGS
jgi:recombinational DNA repair ATPase RecF